MDSNCPLKIHLCWRHEDSFARARKWYRSMFAVKLFYSLFVPRDINEHQIFDCMKSDRIHFTDGRDKSWCQITILHEFHMNAANLIFSVYGIIIVWTHTTCRIGCCLHAGIELNVHAVGPYHIHPLLEHLSNMHNICVHANSNSERKLYPIFCLARSAHDHSARL